METRLKIEKMVEILLARCALITRRVLVEALEAAQQLNRVLHKKMKRLTYPLGGILDLTH